MNRKSTASPTGDWQFDVGQEPERYELDESPRHSFALSRREFCQLMGGGVTVVLLLHDATGQQGGRGRLGGGGGAGQREIGAWLHVDETNVVTVFTGKVEVGQNIRTSLSQVVADELHVPLESVRLVMADTKLTPYDMGTFGSQTTPRMMPQLRRVAAATREILIDLAATHWDVDRMRLSIDAGRIVDSGSDKSLALGELTKGQRLTKEVSERTPVMPPSQWRVAGQSAGKVNGRDIVTGKHQYTSDVRLDDMLFGKVLRPPSLGATLDTIDTSAAAALPDVVVVHDGDFVGVAAPTEYAATRAIAALRATWKTKPQVSVGELFARLKQEGGGRGGRPGGFGRGRTQVGSIDEGLKAAAVRLEQSYQIAYIAHAPLEPRASVAQWQDDRLTVWTGTQRPFGVQGELAGVFRVANDRVRVIVPDTGSGYGGKHTGEAAIEAARLARAAGRAVKLVWTREEEFTWAYFRPAGVIDIKAGAAPDGTLTAWEFHNYNSGASAIESPYAAPNRMIQFHAVDSPLRQGSYRALASTANVFARETAIDELAHALGQDPLAFRLNNLRDPRLRAVFQAAAHEFGWQKRREPRRGFGIGGGTEKGSYVATCAEVEVDEEGKFVRLVRAVSAFECGAVINPDQLRNQVEGAMVMGLGGALFERIEFNDGRILNAGFSKYRVPRFRDAPPIDVVLVDRPDLASTGAGETPIIGIAPAIGNAIFAATGKRYRSMPFQDT